MLINIISFNSCILIICRTLNEKKLKNGNTTVETMLLKAPFDDNRGLPRLYQLLSLKYNKEYLNHRLLFSTFHVRCAS